MPARTYAGYIPNKGIGDELLDLKAANQVAIVALVASDAAGGVFAWQNPEGVPIIITRVLINVTTPATAACTLDAGTTSVSAGTLSDNLIDGPDVHTAAVLADNLLAATQGANGAPSRTLATGKWLTCSMASGATAGLVGYAYIQYIKQSNP